MRYVDTLCTNFIIKNKPRLRYGSEAPSKLIPAEKGRSAIYVMSEGLLEQEEVDYIVEGVQEKEDRPRPQKKRLEKVIKAMNEAPKGKRAKTAREIIGG